MTEASIIADLGAVNAEIIAHNAARAVVETVRGRSQSHMSSWQAGFATFTGDTTVTEVWQADVFEGEMAEGMRDRVAEIISEISSALTQAESIDSGLVNQLSRLDSEIARLQSRRQSLTHTLALFQVGQ